MNTIDAVDAKYGDNYKEFFGIIRENLNSCQLITLCTIFTLYVSEDIADLVFQNKILAKQNSDNMKIICMVFSYIVKMVAIIGQILAYNKNPISFFDSIPPHFLESASEMNTFNYKIIIISYFSRTTMFIFTCLILAVCIIGFVLVLVSLEICQLLKKLKISYRKTEYIEETPINNT